MDGMLLAGAAADSSAGEAVASAATERGRRIHTGKTSKGGLLRRTGCTD